MPTFHEYASTRDFNKRLLDRYGKYKVYLVNGDKVRNSSPSAEEFGGSSIHDWISLIPKDEIWIEDDVKPEERKYLISTSLYQLEHGGKKSYDRALRIEKKLRSINKGQKPSEKVNVHIHLYGHLADMGVWLVDGEKVRDAFKTDFIEGGNPAVYKWIPKNEIWIENGIHDQEIPYIILHEYSEYLLMTEKGLIYDKAHEMASKIEYSERGKRFSKQQALSLTPSKVNEMLNYLRSHKGR